MEVDPNYKDKKIPAGICGILLGSLGVHKFILGYNKEGMVPLSVVLCGVLTVYFKCMGAKGINKLVA